MENITRASTIQFLLPLTCYYRSLSVQHAGLLQQSSLVLFISNFVVELQWYHHQFEKGEVKLRLHENTKEGPESRASLHVLVCSASQGIPYAVPPVGDRRWKSPAPLMKEDGTCWNKTYEATEYKPRCIQRDFLTDRASGCENCFQKVQSSCSVSRLTGVEHLTHFTTTCCVSAGSEDCLYLNVYAPSVKVKSARPVVVFVHGGEELQTGWANLEGYTPYPQLAIRLDMVIVSIQYRCVGGCRSFSCPLFINRGSGADIGLPLYPRPSILG